MKVLPMWARFMPVYIPAVAGWAVGTFVAGKTYGAEFFHVAAEVIPLLLLAVVVDLKAVSINLAEPDSDNWEELEKQLETRLYSMMSFGVALLGLIVLIAGEVVSLLVVAEGASGKTPQGIVLAACFTGLAMVGTRGVVISRTQPGVRER